MKIRNLEGVRNGGLPLAAFFSCLFFFGMVEVPFPSTRWPELSEASGVRRKNLWGPRAMSRFGDVADQATTAGGPGPVGLILSKNQRLGNIECLIDLD